MIPRAVGLIEIGREFFSLLLLAGVRCAIFKRFYRRFSLFLIGFGIWDITYYLWLRVFLGWPDSLLTWDILYLIPVPWTGPVIAPVIVSIFMIAAGLIILYMYDKGRSIRAGLVSGC